MTDYIRRIVSGNKARFKDAKLNMELDLVYLTDQVIIMGYPASGIEGWYRNQREDTKKFLEHRHGKNFWVFNFCPIRENSYDASLFDGRVSRYPFPDHHAPPLAIMPLLAREMRVWLSGSPDRVAVLHCKAGKGRSGTMACTYLLSLDDSPTPPKLERSYTAKQWAELRADEAMAVVPDDVDDDTNQPTPSIPGTPTEEPDSDAPTNPTPDPPTKSYPDALKNIFELHTSRRMKASSPGKKVKQGVSIPSQRRWLYYWALLLAHAAPPDLWVLPPAENKARVRLTQITLRVRETSSTKISLLRAANMILDRTKNMAGNAGTGTGDASVWVSLARYDDAFVELLERWEKHTRDEKHMGWRRKGSDNMEGEEVSQIFEDGKWDREKMVRSFARLGAVGEGAVVKSNAESEKEKKIFTYTLRPLTEQKWDAFRDELEHKGTGTDAADVAADLDEAKVPVSETNSINEATQSAKEKGVVLDAGREVRMKLYMGQVFMGWAWFIPTFHMSHSSPTTKLLLTRKELDFPLGIGSGIIDVEVALEWLKETDVEGVQPPSRMGSVEEGLVGGLTVAAVQAATAGNLAEVVEANRSED
ncbi:Phosphatidylinositol 3,4,5-trisphosphate 3-phosphatase and dual-specificity protein phosphatase PTEN [Hypsizygus marmoreus]|uniref:phosphatidylinositol-3,4,5-trisphosphate 3-phosphatase n=1 Tax=Hypsizygus marmoreus TaxID=39966 RepID=A0A369K6W9_HYPMA|nr:Phosphatidylinositol 3,4,5-trisphosphate 3-phosphatase and dual-specificity protein phosphatase PTEN [Hypsizygus marmoreus]